VQIFIKTHSTQCDSRKLLYPKNIIFLKYNNCKDYIIYNLGHIILEKTVSVWYNSEKNIIFAKYNILLMEFWDREVEKNRIKKQLNKDGKTCFIVIYGRRRLGKSTLIRQVLSKDDIYFEADRSEQSQQRHLLCQTFSQAISGIDQIPFTDYDAILNYTNRVCKKRSNDMYR